MQRCGIYLHLQRWFEYWVFAKVIFKKNFKTQFQRLLSGDRFFFTHANGVGSQFNQNQIQLLRNVRMSDIVCKNSAVSQIQRQAFQITSGSNPLTSCTNAYNLDIDALLGEHNEHLQFAGVC